MSHTLYDLLAGLVSEQIYPTEIPSDQWPEVIQLALRSGLAPMLLWSVKRRTPELVVEQHWDDVIYIARAGAMTHVLLKEAQLELHAAMHTAAIPIVWLKGIVLADTVYPQPVLRPMGDLDALVPAAQKEQAVMIAQSLGYRIHDSGGEHNVNHYHMTGDRTNLIRFELHFRLLGEAIWEEKYADWFWSQTESLSDSGLMVLKVEAHLLYLCAHLMWQHGSSRQHLRWFLDIYRIVITQKLDWHLVINHSIDLKWTYIIEQAFIGAIKWFNAPIPDWVLEELQKHHSSDENIIRIERLKAEDTRGAKVISLLPLLNWQQKIAYVLKIIIPSPAYMRQRYVAQHTWQLLFYYPYRWWDIARGMVAFVQHELRNRRRVQD